MATSRKLKIGQDYSTPVLLENLNLLITNNNKAVKVNFNCPTVENSEKPICNIKDKSNLILNRKIGVEQSIPSIDLDILLEECLLRTIAFDTIEKNISNKENTNIKQKIGFSDLTIDLQKILNDAKDIINLLEHKNCFGRVNYNKNTHKIDFYSQDDSQNKYSLGNVNLTESFQEIEDKIPIIFINNDILEIEQEL